MADIRLIVVPYELGGLRHGVGRGPEALLAAGAEDALAEGGATVGTELIELSERFDNEIDASFELMRRVAEAVRAARGASAFPVVLSGSCFVSVGVVAGLGEPDPGVVWFDAHADFNDTATTPSGYLDGMPVAILVGDAWQTLARAIPGARPLPDTSIVLAGARDFDDAEEVRVGRSAINHLSPDRLDETTLAGAVASISPRPTGIYLHVDLDVLGAEEASVNVYSAPDGVPSAELEALAALVLADDRTRAVSLTAYDPECDGDRAVPPIALRLLSAVGRRAAG